MIILYILAHFDDEYFAWPIIAQGVKAGADQRFFYIADYPSEGETVRRRLESERFLAQFGVPASSIVHVGAGKGLIDGSIYVHQDIALEALRAEAARIGSIDRLVVTAWEGGHPDHDACALMAIALSQVHGGLPVDQFALYSGRGLPGRLFHAGRPLPENGAVQTVGLTVSEWLSFLAAVRFYPSQWRSWLGLWPMMFLTFLRQGFGYQHLNPARVDQRPHAGPLFYERVFKVPYDALKARAAEARHSDALRPAAMGSEQNSHQSPSSFIKVRR
ncbi:hypothetical protein M9M90_07215 [Phenylobacterium sp. LH3H17]|uniref:hypothetical protein n=1 Tax=Phenylobacterium sp. LH3H17 TaxID=2903901 RepID=UPI0020CA0A86|nr:hypothetical protein [Phenylobacterium sp. LH3H17]UTP40964.1 hypothetical protein M9M90_07215 [Phenylobacterium sp. LH3H17]